MSGGSEGISIGWNCHSAMTGVSMRIRSTKANGYKTCPFDEMITNYRGIIECIKDDFKHLCDVQYLELIKVPKESKWCNTKGDGDTLIYNNKYKFLFNHESPGHADLYISQKWAKGINHYTMNNYEEFINRYQRRIENIKELLNSNRNITFILTRPQTNASEISELNEVIKNKYPNLKYKFVILDCDKKLFYDHLLLMKISMDDDEVKRLCI
jgi:hypothetical protein